MRLIEKFSLSVRGGIQKRKEQVAPKIECENTTQDCERSSSSDTSGTRMGVRHHN